MLPLAAAVAAFTALAASAAELVPTSAAAGPYHVAANRILDRDGQPYLLRATELAPVSLKPLESGDLGALSATALVTIRQRLNMNGVELPVDAAEFTVNPDYRRRAAEIVRIANRLDLLVVLSPGRQGAPEAFWQCLAALFRDQPNVFFDAGDGAGVAAIRGVGARQPAIVDSRSFPVLDANVIYRVTATYAASDRWKSQVSLVESAPVLVAGLDPHLNEKSAECDAFPGDPADASNTVREYLGSFDERKISWIVSAFVPGLLITDTRTYTGTKLDGGWVCGEPLSAGLGMVVLSHLRHADPHGLFVVNQGNGGYFLSPGGRASAYGPTFADHSVRLKPGEAPRTAMDNVSVHITDSQGVVRLAPMLYTGAGWASLNFVVPEDVAVGPADIAIVRKDGSQSADRVILTDIAPGFYSASADARGPATAVVTQRAGSGTVRRFDAFTSARGRPACVPIPLSAGVATTLRLNGTGFRRAHAVEDFEARVGETVVPVVSFGIADGPRGDDQLTLRLPDSLIGTGETDVLVKVRGMASNVVRIWCGGKR